MKNLAIIATGIILVSGLGTGCVSAPVAPRDTRITLAQNLGDAIYVTDVRCARNESGYLRFQANVVNNRSSETLVEYKVVWLDAGGLEIDSIMSTWQRVALQPNDIKGLQAVSPHPDAVDMRFYARGM